MPRDLLGDFEGGSLIEQRIDIVQALRRHAVILMVHVDVFAKVGLDAGNTHFEQRFQELVLIPIDSLVVSEVDCACIVEGREIGSTTCRFVNGRTVDHRGLADIMVRLGFF